MNAQFQTQNAVTPVKKPVAKKYTREECLDMIANGREKMNLVRMSSLYQFIDRSDFVDNILKDKVHTDVLMFLYYEETKIEPNPYTSALKNKYFTNQVELFLKQLKEKWDSYRTEYLAELERDKIQQRIRERNAELPSTTADIAKKLGVSKSAVRAAKANGTLQKDTWGRYVIKA